MSSSSHLDIGTFYVDPQKPTNELTNKKKKKPKKKEPDARFITSSGKIAIDLATTGHVRDAPKASVVVTSKSGNITLNLLPADDESRPRLDLNVTNNSGKVVVFIPRTYGGPIQLQTKSGSFEFLPAISQHINVVKAGETESLVLFGSPSSHSDYCQINTRSGKIIIGLKDEDKVVEELGFWQRLFHPRPSRPPSPQPEIVITFPTHCFNYVITAEFGGLDAPCFATDIWCHGWSVVPFAYDVPELRPRASFFCFGMSLHQAGCFGTLFRRKHSSTRTSRARDPPLPRLRREAGPPAPVGSPAPPALKCHYLTPCDHSYADAKDWWLETDVDPPAYPFERDSEFPSVIDTKLDALSPELRKLSLDIHDHPELAFSEIFAHDVLTSFMASHGFTVTKNYLGLDTAFRAEFTHGKGGRVLGINSGHACGHNLIAWSGCGAALAVKAALEAHNIPGKVVLLGTPAEEGGGGKVILLERGGYDDMDLCVMCHPSPGPKNSASIARTIAVQDIKVEYAGRNAHAGAAPWEGTNALDAAFLAYSNISVLRQQMKPDHRVHGIIESNGDWVPNGKHFSFKSSSTNGRAVIPDYAKMHWLVRAPTSSDLAAFVERVKNCFEAAALATSCEMKLHFEHPYWDLNQNQVLGQEFSDIVMKRYGIITSTGIGSASTDFGNVSYALPALHPGFAIPTVPNGGNHTIGFTKAAATQEAHEATLLITKGLAHTGLRALRDDDFFKQVKEAFIHTQANAGNL
ncbi:Aminoacylase 1-like protein 2 [Mycena sanguinolenta]|uniref:Aminoacylase 1-like protein 2 n=1 Tax=Mycena sanguinolenta TaxID=230812 RepID=A0A8H6Z433_9AGAR|nr:Aminoacylase 1-like protein 2 [Mycena sanguinolenta]